ncbi:MAG: glycosyltransferase family 2 protein [Nitrosarchaeum sp.]
MKPIVYDVPEKQPKVTIGLGVYNGERFLHKKIESLLNQTFPYFEIIISDNASIDLTPKICEEYVKNDKRIRYVRQEKNIGHWNNYNFLLREARGEYFMWSAVDDITLPLFLEENIKILEENKDVVVSISKIKMYGDTTEFLNSKSNAGIFSSLWKKFLRNFGHLDSYPVHGTYEARIENYFKNISHSFVFYGIYRTQQIRQSFVDELFIGNDGATTLNVLKFGEIFVLNEILLHVYDSGMSRKGMIGVSREMNSGIGFIFPHMRFTNWCAKNIGTKIFLKKLGFFIKLNCYGEISLVIDLMRKIKNSGSK